MAEGGDQPWSSHRRQHQQDDSEETDSDEGLLSKVVDESEVLTDEEAPSKTSVACDCSSDFPDSNHLSDCTSCPDLSDLEVRRRSRSFGWLVRKITRRSTRDRRGNSIDDTRADRRDERKGRNNGRGLQKMKSARETSAPQQSYGVCLQEAKRVRELAEIEARNRRQRRSQRRPRSLVVRSGNAVERQDSRRRRWSFYERFRRVFEDTDHGRSVIEEPVNLTPVVATRRERHWSSTRFPINLEEFENMRRDRSRLKAEHIRMEYYLINDILSVTNCQWYWGKINRYQAEKVGEN